MIISASYLVLLWYMIIAMTGLILLRDGSNVRGLWYMIIANDRINFIKGW